MAASLSFKSFSFALAALGFTGVAPPGGGARIVQMPAVVPASAPASDVDDDHPLTLKKAPDGLFYVTADVNGVPIRFVVDTGANVVVLTKRDAEAAGVERSRGPSQSLRTAAGDSAMHWATIDRVTVGNNSIARADAAIVAGEGLPHSLLGQSVLSRLESVTLHGSRIELR